MAMTMQHQYEVHVVQRVTRSVLTYYGETGYDARAKAERDGYVVEKVVLIRECVTR